MLKFSKIHLMFKMLSFGLFLATYLAWPGSKLLYIIFSISFMLLLYFSFNYRRSAGYLFFVVTLWVGYWLKLSLHILDPTLLWMEPTGAFDFSIDAWNEVAIVSSVGALGVFVGGWACKLRLKVSNMYLIPFEKSEKLSVFFWLLGFFVLFGLLIVNESYHLVQGPVPSPNLHLPWHLQGFFNWCVATGIILLLTIPLYIDMVSSKLLRGMIFFIVASMLLSLSFLSRGIIVFNCLVLLSALYAYRTFLPRPKLKQILGLFLLMIVAIAITLVLSQLRREDARATPSAQGAPSAQGTPSAHGTYILSNYSWFLLMKLPIERWVGLEAVMAMTGHDGKGGELMIRAIRERRTEGVVDMYTREIALSELNNTKAIMYSTPPTVFAFWYYSSSLLLVFLGSFIFSFILLLSEVAVFKVSKNPFLSSALGIQGAVALISMGNDGLLILSITLCTSLIFAFLIGMLSRRFFGMRV